MGTMLYAKGVFINRCFESLNLTQPELVGDVHDDYLRAGADVIETNTFGANRMKLRSFGLGGAGRRDQRRRRAHRSRRRGSPSRRRRRRRTSPARSVPLGVRIEPWGKTGVDEAEAMFREQAQALFDAGVDLFVLETFRDLNEIGAAIAAVRSVCDLPIVAQMTTEEDGGSLDGTPPEQFAPALVARGANVVGVNCSVGPAPMLETIERMGSVVDAWISAQPNAGKPRDIEGRNLYLCTPEYMASYARRFIASGVRLVGGCCGTTPEHIRQIALATKSLAPGVARVATQRASRDARRSPASRTRKPRSIGRQVDALAQAGRGSLRHRGRAGPAAWARGAAGARPCQAVVGARCRRDHGSRRPAVGRADERAVGRGPGSAAGGRRSRCCSTRVAIAICSAFNPTCWARTRWASATCLGITGDVRTLGDIPDATAVFDVDSIGLTNVITRLNHGARHRRPAAGRADGVPHRRDGESVA